VVNPVRWLVDMSKPTAPIYKCQRLRKNLPLGRSKSRPFGCERLGACGPHIASTFQGALVARPILLGLLFAGFHEWTTLIEAVAFAVHLEDVHVVSEPIQQCAGRAFRAEGFRPLFERQIACDERRAAFVTLRD
jgi:hypothetical protein